MNSKVIIGAVLGLVAGLLIGFTYANYLNKNESTMEPAAVGHSVQGAPEKEENAPGMLADVQKTLDDAKNKPDDANAQLKAGEMFARIQRYDKALDYYKRAAELSPDNLEANAGLGRIYFEKKDFEQSEKYFQKAVEIDAADAGLRSDLGLTYYLRDPPDVERAITEYRKALQIDAGHEATLQNLCVALNSQGKKEELAKTMDLLRKVNPNNEILEKFKEK